MMAATSTNRSMFRRLVRRLLFANRGRLFVVLLALSAGAAVSAALLNLQTDAKRRINSEFRSFGANVLVVSSEQNPLQSFQTPRVMINSMPLPALVTSNIASSVSFFYVVAQVSRRNEQGSEVFSNFIPVVVGGINGDPLTRAIPLKVKAQTPDLKLGPHETWCILGARLANRIQATTETPLVIRLADRESACRVSTIAEFGGAEDDQLFLPISEAQFLTRSEGKIGLIAINFSGSPGQMDGFAAALRHAFPDADVRPLRQFSEAQSKVYSRISGLLTAAIAIILILTALCVMAAMTNIAAERKHDVGMMKAIGGSARSILNLFLTEAVLLGLIGGLIGAAAGIALSIALGKAVFGVAAAPRLIVYPIAVSLTVIVAILGAYPLRRLASVRPATIFRGEA
ncbi:MAG: ABC transporter permease [Acidobacteria bacterium]|nr:ABC transporter permease [Acidobacteriota bacterium]MBS1867900.1 ABC transporter permease [Acidobacteriota bacterium]